MAGVAVILLALFLGFGVLTCFTPAWPMGVFLLALAGFFIYLVVLDIRDDRRTRAARPAVPPQIAFYPHLTADDKDWLRGMYQAAELSVPGWLTPGSCRHLAGTSRRDLGGGDTEHTCTDCGAHWRTGHALPGGMDREYTQDVIAATLLPGATIHVEYTEERDAKATGRDVYPFEAGAPGSFVYRVYADAKDASAQPPKGSSGGV